MTYGARHHGGSGLRLCQQLVEEAEGELHHLDQLCDTAELPAGLVLQQGRDHPIAGAGISQQHSRQARVTGRRTTSKLE